MGIALEYAIPFLFALGLFAYSANIWWRMRAISRWSRVEAKVLKLQVIEIAIDEGEVSVRGYRPQITYVFPFGGNLVKSNTLCLDSEAFKFYQYSQARQCTAGLVVGASINIFVSPNGDSVFLNQLDRRRLGHYWAVFLGGVVVALLGCLLLAIIRQ